MNGTEKNLCVKRWHYIRKDTTDFEVKNAVSLTFQNIGTWAVEIDGKIVMPNGEYTDNLTGNNRIKHRYTIKFIFDSGIVGDAELKDGKWLIFNVWEDIAA